MEQEWLTNKKHALKSCLKKIADQDWHAMEGQGAIDSLGQGAIDNLGQAKKSKSK